MNKVAGYKINIQKSLAFLYTNHEKTERKLKETIPFTITMKRIKYWGIYLPKETKDRRKLKHWWKKSKKTQIDGEIYHVHGLEESTQWKWVYYPKQSLGMIQCNSYQTTNSIFQRTRTNNFTICMEIQKTLNSQSNLEKEEWNRRNQPAWLQALLQSHSHQDSMVLAQTQKYRSMEQNRKPRDKSMHLWTPYLWQRRQEYTMEKRQSL